MAQKISLISFNIRNKTENGRSTSQFAFELSLKRQQTLNQFKSAAGFYSISGATP